MFSARERVAVAVMTRVFVVIVVVRRDAMLMYTIDKGRTPGSESPPPSCRG